MKQKPSIARPKVVRLRLNYAHPGVVITDDPFSIRREYISLLPIGSPLPAFKDEIRIFAFVRFLAFISGVVSGVLL